MPKRNYSEDELYKIEGVEVFSAGKWNGDEVTSQDLDDMVEAFDETSQTFRPALKLGHTEDQKLLQEDGMPAAGWVGRLYRMGDKLVADFIDIPKEIYRLVKNKAYRNVSSEVYWNIDAGEKKYRRMLAAVALLGADAPAVMNLKDILARYGMRYNPLGERKCYAMELEGLKIKTYAQDPTEEDDRMSKELEQKVEGLEAEIKKYKADASAKSELEKEVAELKTYREKAEAEKADLAKKAAEAELESKVNELITSKAATPAMKPYIKALLGEEKKVYSLTVKDEEKKLSKFDLIKECFSLLKAVENVSTSEKSQDGDDQAAKDAQQKTEADIQKYMADHKVTYGAAYRVIMSGKVKPGSKE